MEVFGQITHIFDENSQIRLFNNLNTNRIVFTSQRDAPSQGCFFLTRYITLSKDFCPALTKLALDLHVNFCMLYVACPVFFSRFSLSNRPSSFCLIQFGG